MKATWIVEHINTTDTQRLVDNLKKSGKKHKILSENLMYSNGWQSLVTDDPVVVHGSIQFCGMIRRKRPEWNVFSTLENYSCNIYYPKFGDLLLNNEYAMIPFGDLSRRKDWLFDTFGEQNTIFVRPNSGNKIFTGKVIHKEDWDKDMRLIGFYNPPDEEICVISSPKNVVDEWRFFISDGKIVTGSQYKDRDKFVENPIPYFGSGIRSMRAELVVNSVLEQIDYNPDKVWSLDICRTREDNYYVLEVGCFSCAGLYGADTAKLINCIEDLVSGKSI